MASDDLALEPYVPDRWSPELRNALNDWEFGCLVPAPPLAWVQYPGVDSVLQVEVSAEPTGDVTDQTPEGAGANQHEGDAPAGQPVDPTKEGSDLVVVEDDWGGGENGRVVGGVVVSQTCDIVSSGPGARHPFVQVAPVVKVEDLDANRREAMEGWAVADRALLDPPGWDGTYVADLRLSIPVSKDVLARHKPVPAFGDEERMLLFADHVATKVGRPALHDFLSETVPKHIGQAIKASKDDASWFAPVEEVLVIAEPTRLNPTSAKLLVVSEDPLDAAGKQGWHDVNEGLVQRGRAEGITMRSPKHAVARKLTADVYRSAVRLYVPELRTPPYDA